MQKKILLIVHHRYDRSPGQRFRIEQFLPALKNAGYEVILSNIISEDDDKKFYARGHYLWKFFFTLRAFRRRLYDLRNAQNFDLIFIYREAQMLGTTLIEKKLAKTGVPIIYDFDDSIWLNDTSEGNKNLAWLKRTSKTADICKYATLVSVGNMYLADYAKQFNKNIFVLPTVLNTEYHKSVQCFDKQRVCIGWTGTQPTMKHYQIVLPVLQRLKLVYGDKVYFKVITNSKNWQSSVADTKVVQWTLENEIAELSEFDIGIMPLPDDEWSRGKCGFKGLQCMALSLPVVMSPVGVNTEIIDDGINGYLADTEDEWFEKLSFLIESPDIRKSMGKEARSTIVNRYSVAAWENVVVEKFDSIIKK